MKALPIAALFVLAGFLTSGCQESPVTGPVSEISRPMIKAADLQNNVLPFHVMLRDPSLAFNSFLEVNGEVAYRVNRSSPAKSASYYEVSLITDATITPLDWDGDDATSSKAGGKSSDRIQETDVVMDQGYFEISKSYTVEGRKDGLMLNIVFRIEEDAFSVATISFSVEDGSGTDTSK